MSNSPLKHVVFIPAPSWGHLRPAMKTSLRMVEKFPDLFISLFVNEPDVPKATKYLNSQLSNHSNRVRIVNAPPIEAPSAPSGPVETIAYFEKAFKIWVTQELEQTGVTEVEGRVVGKPSWIIEDLFNGGVSLASKEVHSLPVASWWTTTAASLIRQVLFDDVVTLSNRDSSQQGNAENGHGGKVFESIAQKGAVSPAEAGEMYLQGVTDRLICVPGIPTYHEWELAPQYFPFYPALVAHMIARRENMIKHVDQIICCTTFELEPIAATALANALGKPLKPIFIGPAVDPVVPHTPDPESPVTQFLDKTYAEKGAHSVIYIAFGTAFFPLPGSMSHLMTILDEIAAQGFKFIFALPASRAQQLDKSWIDAHVKAGNGIFPEWTNQTEVLEHPAIHYFLSHGGWSSSTESLVRGVPMIFWPFVSDQPINSKQLVAHDVGFELLQVRTGPAKSKAYQNGAEVEIVGTDEAVREEIGRMLEVTKSERGVQQRRSARLLGRVVVDSLAVGGSADAGLEAVGGVLGL